MKKPQPSDKTKNNKPHWTAILNVFPQPKIFSISPDPKLKRIPTKFPWTWKYIRHKFYNFRLFTFSIWIVKFKIVIERCFPTDVNFEAVFVLFSTFLAPPGLNSSAYKDGCLHISVVRLVSLVSWTIPYLEILINFLIIEKLADYLRTVFKRDLLPVLKKIVFQLLLFLWSLHFLFHL